MEKSRLMELAGVQLKEGRADDEEKAINQMADVLEKLMDESQHPEGTERWHDEATGLVDWFLREIKTRGLHG